MSENSKSQSLPEQEGKEHSGGFTLQKPADAVGVFASPPPLQFVEDGDLSTEKPSDKVAQLVEMLLNHGPQDETGEIYTLLSEISSKEYTEMEALYRSKASEKKEWGTLSTHFQEANTLIPQIFRDDPEKRDVLLKRFSGFSGEVSHGQGGEVSGSSIPAVRFDARLKKGGTPRTTFNLGDQIVVNLILPGGTQLVMDDDRIPAFVEGKEVGASYKANAEDDGEEVSFPIEFKNELSVGNHSMHVPLSFSDGGMKVTGTSTASFEFQVVDPLEEFKGEERNLEDYTSHRVREEVREQGMAGWAQDGGIGTNFQIVTDGTNPGRLTVQRNVPIGPGPTPKKRFLASYAVSDGPGESGYSWVVVPENAEQIPIIQQANFGSTAVELAGLGLQGEGSHGLKLNAKGGSANFTTTVEGVFKVVAQQQSGVESGTVPPKAVFRQVVLTDEEMDGLEEQQEYTNRMDEEVENADESVMVPVDAKHFDDMSGQERSLRMFISRDQGGEQRLVLLDMTKDAQRRRFAAPNKSGQSKRGNRGSKGGFAEQVEYLFNIFDKHNKYSSGHVVYQVLENDHGIPTASGMIKTDGESLGEEVGKWLGRAGTVLSIAAMAVPVIGVPVAVVRAIAVGATIVDGVATAVLLNEHFQQENPSSMDLALDLLGMVGPLAAGGRKLSKALDLNGQKLIAFTELTAGGAEVILASAQGVEQIQEVWDSDLSSEEKAKQISAIVGGLVLSGGMYAVGAKGDWDELGGGRGVSRSGGAQENESGERGSERNPVSEQEGEGDVAEMTDIEGGKERSQRSGNPVPANGERYTPDEIIGIHIKDLNNGNCPLEYNLHHRKGELVLYRTDGKDSSIPKLLVDEAGIIRINEGRIADSRALAANMGGDRPDGYQTHHLVSNRMMLKLGLYREMRKRGIYDPDNSENGIFLPKTRADAQPEDANLPTHNGPHNNWDHTTEEVVNDQLAGHGIFDVKLALDADLIAVSKEIEDELRGIILNLGPIELK